MKALKQGQLDGLCGVYAIINACEKLIGTSLEDNILNELFKISLKAVCAKKFPHFLWEGAETTDMLKIASDVTKHLRKLTGLSISFDQPFLAAEFDTARHFLEKIDEADSTGLGIYIVWLDYPIGEGNHPHWTVVSKITEDEIILHDSTPTRSRMIKSLRISGKNGTRIRTKETIRFTIPRD